MVVQLRNADTRSNSLNFKPDTLDRPISMRLCPVAAYRIRPHWLALPQGVSRQCTVLAGVRRQVHQRVPGRMKRHGVDALTARIERVQLGRVAIAGVGQFEHRRAPELRAPCGNGGMRRTAAFAHQPFLQRDVVGEEIAVGIGRRLIRK